MRSASLWLRRGLKKTGVWATCPGDGSPHVWLLRLPREVPSRPCIRHLMLRVEVKLLAPLVPPSEEAQRPETLVWSPVWGLRLHCQVK